MLQKCCKCYRSVVLYYCYRNVALFTSFFYVLVYTVPRGVSSNNNGEIILNIFGKYSITSYTPNTVTKKIVSDK